MAPHCADGWRLTVRVAGAYLDLDELAVASFDAIPAAAVGYEEQSRRLNNAALFFPKHSPALWRLMHAFVHNYRPCGAWGDNGPNLLTSFFGAHCCKRCCALSRQCFDGVMAHAHPKVCKEVAFVDERVFYPFAWQYSKWDRAIADPLPSEEFDALHARWLKQGTVTAHMWLSAANLTDQSPTSLMNRLCPADAAGMG
jgi:hypothetical protein